MTKRLLLVIAGCVAVMTPLHSAAPIHYRFTFPEPHHRWMQVDATFSDLDPRPLELRMSRSSPGRYALHDFAKNVYDVSALAADGRALRPVRTDVSAWSIADHGGGAKVTYKVYGDRVDGTYLAVDETHAHINMPAVVMWARGLDDRAATVSFVRPANTRWTVATQLHAGATDLEFTAPNLQYLMDSPAEFSALAWRQFSVAERTFRFAAHHTGTDRELDAFVGDVERIVRQEGALFGEYPRYEPGHYTFIADYLPFGHDDGMEHRNSAVLTSGSSIASRRGDLLEGVAHEFFHSWNVERIRPRNLEPYDLERVNATSELWLAEGFTQYYGPLVLARAGLLNLAGLSASLTGLVDGVTVSSARSVHSLEQTSLMAGFLDGSHPVDRTNWSRSFLSYYTFGAGVALALDLSLRVGGRSELSLDDFMRAMWRKFGRSGGAREGYVDHPYTAADVEATLAEAGRDRAFAREFFARFIEGREAADYARLLDRAGFVVRRSFRGTAWLGDLTFEPAILRVTELVAPSWPIYAAGLEQDDLLERLDGQIVRSIGDVDSVLARRRPGDQIEVAFTTRAGRSRSATVTLIENPHVEVVPVEADGGSPTAAQRTFRNRWLTSPY